MQELHRVEISEYQKLFWLEWKMNPKGTQFNTPVAFYAKGPLDQVALSRAAEITLHQYMLNASSYFKEENGKTYQIFVKDEKPFSFEPFPWDKSKYTKEQVIEAFIYKYSNQAYNLEQYPIFTSAILSLMKMNMSISSPRTTSSVIHSQDFC